VLYTDVRNTRSNVGRSTGHDSHARVVCHFHSGRPLGELLAVHLTTYIDIIMRIVAEHGGDVFSFTGK
jgi:hypothetical protein